MYKLNFIFSIIIIQYLIILIFIKKNSDNFDEKIINSKDKLYFYINDIFKYLSMYYLIFKYHDEFIGNKFTNQSSQIIKLNYFMKDNTCNYIGIGNKIIVYFYKRNDKFFINISPLFLDEFKKNYKKMSKYIYHHNLVKILTMHKYDTSLNLYKYSGNKFDFVGKKNNIEETFDFLYNENKNINNIMLMGFCLGGNILYLLYKYIKLQYNIKIKLITFETYFYEKPNINNHINIYTYNSYVYWMMKKKQCRIDYVYKLKNTDIINNILDSNLLFPFVEYNNYAHYKHYILNRK